MALPRRRPRNPEGAMTLAEHFREFRRRLLVSAISVVVAAVVASYEYQRIMDVLLAPIYAYQKAHPEISVQPNFASAVTGGFSTLLSVSIWAGIILSSPVWLYQAWAFIMPGLTKREKRVSMLFVAAIVPLFLLGCALGYWTLPQSYAILVGLVPDGTAVITDGPAYVSFVTRFILVFGLSFLFPVVLVALNYFGLMPYQRLRNGWRLAVVFIFVFAAVATPTGDPFTMFMFALPLVILYGGVLVVTKLISKRREANRPDWLKTPDTEASPL